MSEKDKMLEWCPTKYIWFHFGDNDFGWSAQVSVGILVERLRLRYKESTIPVEYVQDCFRILMKHMSSLQHIGFAGEYPTKMDDYFKDVTVQYVDEYTSISSDYWNGEDIYVDTWTGELYFV